MEDAADAVAKKDPAKAPRYDKYLRDLRSALVKSDVETFARLSKDVLPEVRRVLDDRIRTSCTSSRACAGEVPATGGRVSDCPVCGKVGIDKAATRCPQCHADLECFALLDALHEGTPAPQVDLEEVKQALDSLRETLSRDRVCRGPRGWGWPALTAIAGLAAMILVMQILTQDRQLARQLAEPPAQDRTQEPVATAAALEAISGGIERLAHRLAAIEGRLDAVASEQAKTIEQAARDAYPNDHEGAQTPPSMKATQRRLAASPLALSPLGEGEGSLHDFRGEEAVAPVEKAQELVLHHHLRPDETLWSIAKRYYGKGELYPVLIAQNPGLGVYHKGTGILRILAVPEEAVELYRSITPPGGEGRLFRYRVQPGDDWRGLAARFLGRPSRARELIALNPESDLTPGEQVLIALE